jgi:hypothetical protein
MGQAILPKLLRCISKPYASDYHCASDMPTGSASPCRATSGAAAASPFALHSNYHNESDLAELEPTFRQVVPIHGQHISSHPPPARAATFGMILIVQGSDVQSKLARPLL